ncbi:MAG: hypothetical protein ABI478_11110 [Propionivibrio sp.]
MSADRSERRSAIASLVAYFDVALIAAERSGYDRHIIAALIQAHSIDNHREIVVRQIGLAAERIDAAIERIADALEAAHAHQVVHNQEVLSLLESIDVGLGCVAEAIASGSKRTAA